MSPPRSRDEADREQATNAILDRSQMMADEFEAVLRESEALLERLRTEREAGR